MFCKGPAQATLLVRFGQVDAHEDIPGSAPVLEGQRFFLTVWHHDNYRPHHPPPWPFCDWTPRAKGSFSLLDGRIWWKSMYSSCHIWDFILSVECKSIGTSLKVKVEVVPVTMDAVDALALSTANDTAALAISSICFNGWVIMAAIATCRTPLQLLHHGSGGSVLRLHDVQTLHDGRQHGCYWGGVFLGRWRSCRVGGGRHILSLAFGCEAVALTTPLDALRLGGMPGTMLGRQQTQC